MVRDKRILVVDDDRNIVKVIEMYLLKEGYSVVTCTDGEEAIRKFTDTSPDLVLLDIMLPKKDGLEVLKDIRKKSNIPVLMLTAKGDTFDRVIGLELGADDYVVKPFEVKELLARVKAVLRRTNSSAGDQNEIVLPRLTINRNDYTVSVNGKKMQLPAKELELLYFLASNPNIVFSREQILEKVWGFDFYGETRTVDVHVKRLREKIECDDCSWSITTVWGVGYKFEVK